MSHEFAAKTVLVVDDYPDACEDYKLLLETELGCNVLTATSGESALDIMSAGGHPDLVLLDLKLPVPEEGLRVCRSIKAGHLRPEVQVVIFTAAAESPQLIKDCLANGADDFLSKLATDDEKVARITSKLRAQENYLRLVEFKQRADRAEIEQELARRAAVAEFAAGVNHDVRNSLFAPVALVAFAETAPEIPDIIVNAAREQLEVIGQLTASLEELSKAGGSEQPSTVDVPGLFESSFLLVRYRALQHNIIVLWDAPAVSVFVFRPNLLFTLTELVVNGVKAISKDPEREEGSTGEIRLMSEKFQSQGKPWVRILVSDNGPGVPPHLANQLFEPGAYWRPDGSGSGQGLFIARQRIERAGGRIYYEPNEPKGARFVIELPEHIPGATGG